MKKKVLGVMLAVVLVLSFSLVTAAPVAADDSIRLTGGGNFISSTTSNLGHRCQFRMSANFDTDEAFGSFKDKDLNLRIRITEVPGPIWDIGWYPDLGTPSDMTQVHGLADIYLDDIYQGTYTCWVWLGDVNNPTYGDRFKLEIADGPWAGDSWEGGWTTKVKGNVKLHNWP